MLPIHNETFDLKKFNENDASETAEAGNPFQGAVDLEDGQTEWQRRLNYAKVKYDGWLLCCPEDVCKRHKCRHADTDLCEHCLIPLCRRCHRLMHKKMSACRIPMSLCNDNFWGYSTDILIKNKIRWIEAAIVSPCWTSMIVYYVEGDQGHLLGEEVGKQKSRTVVRGSCCS